MKLAVVLILSLHPLILYANSYVRCSLQANYEIYKGEGMVERSLGSPIVFPVEFGFFTNNTPMSATLSGGYSSISVKAVSKEDEATVLLSGGANGSGAFQASLAFNPRNGAVQNLSQSQLSPFNYTSPVNRVVFTGGVLKCLPGILWDHRPVLNP